MSKATEMRELFARWEESGQSLMAFGRQEGVSYAKLLYWRRKFEEEDEAPAVSTSELVPIKVVADREIEGGARSKFEVWLSNGVALDVPVGFDETELRRLVGVLQSC